jgi:hypothetical protein
MFTLRLKRSRTGLQIFLVGTTFASPLEAIRLRSKEPYIATRGHLDVTCLRTSQEERSFIPREVQAAYLIVTGAMVPWLSYESRHLHYGDQTFHEDLSFTHAAGCCQTSSASLE